MTILLYKDGKLIVDTEQPLEGVSLDNLAAILSGASDGDVIQYDATKGMWVNKSAPSSLPEVTASDKGKYLKANESTGDPEWASGGSSGGGVLVVHFDENGTLDKTWQEIYDAKCGIIAAEADGSCNSMQIIRIGEEEGVFFVDGVSFISNEMEIISFSASSADGYPVISE